MSRRSRKNDVPLIRNDLLRDSAGFDRIGDVLRQEAEVRKRWLRQYLFAISLIVRIPGGPGYRPPRKAADRFERYIWDSDPHPTVAVLSMLLDQLGVPEILDELPRAGKLAGFKLPSHVRSRLRKLDSAKTLENIVDCLDRLLIAPVHPHFSYHRNGCVRRPLPPVRYDFSI